MLPTYEFFTTLRDMAKVQRGQMTLAQSQTFMKYYNLMPGAKLEKTPKLILYSAHAETLGPIVRYFGAEDKVPFTPEPASMILFDFYEGADARIVAKYVDDIQTVDLFDGKSADFQVNLDETLTKYATEVGAAT